MKFTGITNAFICITAMLLCIELCNCFFVDRSQHDVFDFLNGQNCLSESSRLRDSQRCKCNEKRTIASKPQNNNGDIDCFEGPNIDEEDCGKFTEKKSANVINATFKCQPLPNTTEFWNIENKTNVRGKWQHEDIKDYLSVKNKDIVLDNKLGLFTGLLLRMEVYCGEENYKYALLKIYGRRKYPITTFLPTTQTPATTTGTTITATTTKTGTGKESTNQPSAPTKNTLSNSTIMQNSVPITATTNGSSTIAKNTSSTIPTTNGSSTIAKNASSNIPNPHISSKEDNKNVVTIAVVASLVTMINIILSICLLKRLRQTHKNGEYKIDDRTEHMKGQTDEPIYAEANNNFLKDGSPKKEQNDPSDRQKFVAARMNLQKSRAYQNFTNEDMERKDSQTDLPDYDEPENDFQMISRYENFPLEETPEEQLKVETQPRYVNQDSEVVKNDGYVTMKPCTAESNFTEKMKNQTDCQVNIQEKKNLQIKNECENTKDEKARYVSNSSPISTEQKPEYSELTAQVHGKTLLYTRLSINNPAFTEEPYYRCVDEPEVEESSSSSSDIYYHSVEVDNTTSDEPKSDYTDLDPQYQYKHQEYTDLCLDNLAFIEEPVYRCVDESD